MICHNWHFILICHGLSWYANDFYRVLNKVDWGWLRTLDFYYDMSFDISSWYIMFYHEINDIKKQNFKVFKSLKEVLWSGNDISWYIMINRCDLLWYIRIHHGYVDAINSWYIKASNIHVGVWIYLQYIKTFKW